MAYGVEVDGVVGDQRVENLNPLFAVQPDFAQTAHVAFEQVAEHFGVFAAYHVVVQRHHGREQPLAHVEPRPRRILVTGAES